MEKIRPWFCHICPGFFASWIHFGVLIHISFMNVFSDLQMLIGNMFG